MRSFWPPLILLGGTLGDFTDAGSCSPSAFFSLLPPRRGAVLAPDMGQLVAARALQEIGGACLCPEAWPSSARLFHQRSAAKPLARGQDFTGITAAIGPVIGGWLVEHLSWRWVFFIIFHSRRRHRYIFPVVPESCGEAANTSFDIPGACLITAGWRLVFGMIEAGAGMGES